MTTIRQIITDAYREAGITEIESTLDTDKFAEGLRRFNVLFNSLFENELGEPLLNVNYGHAGLTNAMALNLDQSQYIDNVYVPSNVRLVFNIDSATTLYLNPRPRDGARFAIIDNGSNLSSYNVTVNGNGRKIEGADSITLSTDSLTRQWFYRADTGNWVKVVDFVDGDESPFPEEFDDFLAMLLAVRLNPRHGATTSDEMVQMLKRARRQFRNRYRQVSEQDSEIGLYRLTANRRYQKNTDSLDA